MATEEEINNQKELNEGKSFQRSLEQEILEILQKRAGVGSSTLNNQQDIANVLRDQAKQLQFQNAERSLLNRTARNLTKIAEKNYSLSNQELGTTKGLKTISEDRVSIEKSIRLLRQQQSKFAKSQSQLDNDIAISIGMQVKEASKLLKEVKEIESSSEKLSNNFGVKAFGALSDVTNAIPGLKRFSGPFNEAAEAARAHGAAQIEMIRTGKGLTKEKIKELGLTEKLTTANKHGQEIVLTGRAAAKKLAEEDIKLQGTFRAGLKSLGSSLKKALGPLALFAMLVETLLEADKATTDLAKSMNMTYSEANAVRIELNEVANLSGDAFVTTKGLQESFSFINTQLGSNVRLSGELLTQFTKLREASGLTNEELYGATQLQLTSGKTLNEITGEIMAQAKLTSANNGVILNEKEILKDIKDVSAATTLSLGKNPAAIAEAVTQAKALGMTLGQVEKIAESLLNFESSITSELKAELLLGRDINLERARLLALNNDVAGVAREISSQIGNSADFAKMNVLQQNALAEAVGMNREELAKTLFVQENLGAATGKEAEKRKAILNSLVSEVGVEEARRRLGEQSVEDLEKQAGIQDRFNQAVLKLKEIFVSLAGPILQIVSPIVDLLVPALSTITFLLTPIFDLFKGISGFLTGDLETLDGWQIALGAIALAAGSVLAITKSLAFYNGLIRNYKIAQIALEKANKTSIFGTIGAMTVALGVQLGLLSASLATNAAITFGVGVAVAVAAAAAGYAAIKALTADDMVSGAPGYGKRALYDEGELTLLNNRDTVIAGTDLFKPTPTIQPVNQSQNTSMEVSQLKSENEAIKQETKKTNNLLESLITATKANKTVEMEDTFAPLYGS